MQLSGIAASIPQETEASASHLEYPGEPIETASVGEAIQHLHLCSEVQSALPLPRDHASTCMGLGISK